MRKNPGYLLIRFAKILTLLILIGYLFYTYYYLPRDVAFHFNEFGHADDYIPKGNLFLIVGVFAVVFNVAISLLGRMLTFLPGRAILVPNKSYWLSSSDNRKAMNIVLRNWLNGLTTLINVFLIFALGMLMRLNILQNTDIADYYWAMLVAIVLLGGWLLFLPVRLLFKTPAPAN